MISESNENWKKIFKDIAFYHINKIKQRGITKVQDLLKKEKKSTQPGSLKFLLFGKAVSTQSFVIKMGHFGENLTKELITMSDCHEILDQCGIQNIFNEHIDIDILFKNKNKKIIYYRELKANIDLDSEKIKVTVKKCKTVKKFLELQYPHYYVDYGIFNWSVYNRKILFPKYLSKIKKFENDGIKVDNFEDFLNLIEIGWNEEDFYDYWKTVGKIINNYEC